MLRITNDTPAFIDVNNVNIQSGATQNVPYAPVPPVLYGGHPCNHTEGRFVDGKLYDVTKNSNALRFKSNGASPVVYLIAQ